MEINNKNTAVLVTDAQNDFLSEQGVTWKLVGDSVKENKTNEETRTNIYKGIQEMFSGYPFRAGQ